MVDKLAVELEVPGGEKAISTVQAFRAELVETDALLSGLGSHAGFSKYDEQLAKLETSAGRVQRSFLGIINSDGRANALDGLSLSAIRLQKEAALVRQRLTDIRSVDIRGKSDSFVKILADDAKTAELQLARLEKRAVTLSERRNPVAPGGGERGPANMFSNFANGGQLRGAGPLFRAAGLYQYGIDESILNVANAARAAAGISGGFVAAAGGVAVLGAATIAVTAKIRSQAEQRLITEEAIAAAIQKQAENLKDAFTEYDKFKQADADRKAQTTTVNQLTGVGDTKQLRELRDKQDAENKKTIAESERIQAALKQAESAVEFDKKRQAGGVLDRLGQTQIGDVINRIASANLPLLGNNKLVDDGAKLGIGAKFDEADKQRAIRSDSDRAERLKKQLDETNAQLENGKRSFLETNNAIDAAEKNLNNIFNQRGTDFINGQRDAIEFEKKRLKERIDNINAGREKINEVGRQADQTFTDLFARSGENNPFVTIFTEADRAIERTRLGLAQLTPELQKIGKDLTDQANADALFSARADASQKALNFRLDAADFRNAGRNNDQGNDLAARALQRFKADLASGLLRNPESLRIFQNGADSKTALQLFDYRNSLNEREGLFVNPAFQADQRRRLAADPGNQTVQDRLDKQLANLRSLKPGDQAQQDDIDRRIVALTQGLNPADLNDSQRNAAATAREHLAARAESAEVEARKQRDEALLVQKSIDKNIADLLKLADKDGLTGVIRIINEAEDKANVSIGKRPTARDVKKLSDLNDQ